MAYLVFDIGGTLTKYAVLDNEGEMLFKSEYATSVSLEGLSLDMQEILQNMEEAYGRVDGVGVSVPAVTDADAGVVISEGALVYIKDVPLRAYLSDILKVPVEIENDGNCAALAEAYDGAGKVYDRSAVVVCGTGIGGALVEQRKICKGANFHAGEFGYSVLFSDPTTGTIGTWSEYGSVGALCDKVAKRRNLDEPLSGIEVFERAEAGDYVAIEEIDNYYMVMAMGIHNIQYSLDPEIILLGGGISRRPDFLKRIERKLDYIYSIMENATVRPKIVCCTHFNDANLYGAYYNFLSRQEGDIQLEHKFRVSN